MRLISSSLTSKLLLTLFLFLAMGFTRTNDTVSLKADPKTFTIELSKSENPCVFLSACNNAIVTESTNEITFTFCNGKSLTLKDNPSDGDDVLDYALKEPNIYSFNNDKNEIPFWLVVCQEYEQIGSFYLSKYDGTRILGADEIAFSPNDKGMILYETCTTDEGEDGNLYFYFTFEDKMCEYNYTLDKNFNNAFPFDFCVLKNIQWEDDKTITASVWCRTENEYELTFKEEVAFKLNIK